VIEIIGATRMQEKDFWAKSALGLSLRRLSYDKRLVPTIFYANTRGLPELFNSRITAPENRQILVFIHDDVWLDDYHLADRLIEGLNRYDLLGVAGNRRRAESQPAWPFKDDQFTWDERENLSGSVAHGEQPFGTISYFGPVPAECELLDGVLLAARKSMFAEQKILFDPRFDFHFYDMDLCRAARAKGLRLGTWPVSITHQSSGAFNSPSWREAYEKYRNKWRSAI